MSFQVERQEEFIKSYLVSRILEQNEDLTDHKLENIDVSCNKQLHGFMSSIINLTLTFKSCNNNEIIQKKIVVKLMKGSAESRDRVRADVQFPNEIFVYKSVIPTFLKKFQPFIKTIDPNLWCARVFFSEVGNYPKLSDHDLETILAVEDLSAQGYRMTDSRNDLREFEILLMTKAIAQWHACTYALKIQQDPILDELLKDIIPLCFEENGRVSMYQIMYEIAMKRLFAYLDRTPDELDCDQVKQDMEVLRKKYLKQPLKLMEQFRRQDPVFSTIVHGDFIRNNVMFKYNPQTGEPIDLRMFDFQQLRYGSPCLDLSFYLYMNAHPDLWRAGVFEKAVKYYHENLISAIAELLDCDINDERLEPYCYEDFKKHFDQFAFYGGMIAIHFLPWMTCPLEECERLSTLWYNDMHSPEFEKLALNLSGSETYTRLAEIVRMASRQGHLKMLWED